MMNHLNQTPEKLIAEFYTESVSKLAKSLSAEEKCQIKGSLERYKKKNAIVDGSKL